MQNPKRVFLLGHASTWYICPPLGSETDILEMTPTDVHRYISSVNKATVRAGDLLIVAPDCWSFSFSHGFQINEESPICFKPWLYKSMTSTQLPPLPIQLCILQTCAESKVLFPFASICLGVEVAEAQGTQSDDWILQEVKSVRTMLLNKILNKIRALAHAVFHVRYNPDMLALGNVLRRKCSQCKGFAFVVAVHERVLNPVEDLASTTDGQEVQLEVPDSFYASLLCLDCALRKRPPRTGYDLTIPDWLPVTITKDEATQTVITKISDGVRSALPSMHLLDFDGEMDFRWLCHHKLVANVPLSSNERFSKRPFRFEDVQRQESHPLTDPNSKLEETFKWTKEERQVSKIVDLAKDLMDVEIPAVSPTEDALKLKLKQKQLKRSLFECLSSKESRSKLLPDLNAEEIASVKQSLHSEEVELNREPIARRSFACDRCVYFLRNPKTLEGRTILQAIQAMEAHPLFHSVRYISVPISREKFSSESIPILLPSTYPTRTNRQAKIPRSHIVQSKNPISPSPLKRFVLVNPSNEVCKPLMVIIDRALVSGNLRRIVRESGIFRNYITPESVIFELFEETFCL